MDDKTDLPQLAWTDDDGRIHCEFCDWVSPPVTNHEQAEHYATTHLMDAHGRTVIYRREDGVGPAVDVPH